MATSVGPRCLRLLRGVTSWRSRYSCLGRLPQGRRQLRPNRSREGGVVSLLRARPEEGSGGDGAIHLHLNQVGLPACREVRV